ncbi:hypothetical protein GX48_05110 [Paracoccidioides brasiliensis]|nr:hypothetical protein GX48_05110 [Paracoccidioides brasiliensis]
MLTGFGRIPAALRSNLPRLIAFAGRLGALVVMPSNVAIHPDGFLFFTRPPTPMSSGSTKAIPSKKLKHRMRRWLSEIPGSYWLKLACYTFTTRAESQVTSSRGVMIYLAMSHGPKALSDHVGNQVERSAKCFKLKVSSTIVFYPQSPRFRVRRRTSGRP